MSQADSGPCPRCPLRIKLESLKELHAERQTKIEAMARKIEVVLISFYSLLLILFIFVEDSIRKIEKKKIEKKSSFDNGYNLLCCISS